jgi:hypothetical protein
MSQDDFYIGYERAVPAGVRRHLRFAVIIALVLMIGAAIAAVMLQRRLAPARFDYGHVQQFEGWLTREPAPSLVVLEGGAPRRYWLVAPGKFGASSVIADRDEGQVTLAGTVIAREHWRMIELVPGSVRHVSHGGVLRPEPLRRHPVNVRGEIVDAKCFLGVMNPGEGAAHRDCAVRCLSGGIPPMLAYRDEHGRAHLALLLAPVSQLDRWRTLAGTVIEVSGELVIDGDIEVLSVEAS